MRLLTITDEVHDVPVSGAVDSTHTAIYRGEDSPVPDYWSAESLEHLGHDYWAYLREGSLGLLRVRSDSEGRATVRLAGLIPLLRTGPFEVRSGREGGEVRWPLLGGLLVARDGRGRGSLVIGIDGMPARDGAGEERLRAHLTVENYYPWLRGSGAFARIGTKVYASTQVRFHRIVSHGFFRRIGRRAD